MSASIDDPRLNQDMRTVIIVLQEAKLYELEAEVIYWAFQAMKLNSELTITQALFISLNEWVK